MAQLEDEEVGEFFSVAEEIVRPLPDPIKDEQMRQAKMTFNFAIILGIIGTCILLAGVTGLLFWTIQTDKGGLTLASGIVMDLISLMAIKFHRETNSRLDEIRRDENVIRFVGQIKNQDVRDQAIANLVKIRAKGK